MTGLPQLFESETTSIQKPIHPSEMPIISTCTDTNMDDTNVPTKFKPRRLVT